MTTRKTTTRPRAQGDLTFVPLARLPAGVHAAKAKAGHYTLALGEATGHLHALAELPGVEVFTSADGEDTATAADVYLRLARPATIEHTKGGAATHDHDPLTLDPGVYKVHRQHEYAFQALRQVAD